jgi:hypothetical protein
MTGRLRRLVCVALCLIALDGRSDTSPAVETSRDAGALFDAFGLDAEAFRGFAQHEPIVSQEHELLARILMRLRQVERVDVTRWSRRGVDWATVSNEAEKYQREFLLIEGTATSATRLPLAAEIEQRFALDNVYRCAIKLDSGHTAVVFCRDIPAKWSVDASLDARASTRAVFLKAGPNSAANGVELYFAASGVAWHPDTALGNLGMDYGLFDSVRQLRPISSEESECFYQMLAAAGRMQQDRPAEVADPVAQLTPLMQAPADQVGKPCSFRGIARRAVKIHVNDPGIAARFGFEHYFEVVVFVDLGGVADVAGEKVRSYPVVFCLRQLPPELPLGDHIDEVVEVSGFMFKKWPYTTEMTEEIQPGLRIYSPLLIGKTATVVPRPQAPEYAGSIAGAVLAATIAGVGLAVWWFNRRERRVREELAAYRRNARS